MALGIFHQVPGHEVASLGLGVFDRKTEPRKCCGNPVVTVYHSITSFNGHGSRRHNKAIVDVYLLPKACGVGAVQGEYQEQR